ncbi:SCO family protein [Albirhodobacter sp. R86504]|uniref:SCO family protein n=1 Tax=Albirhodobacter sp. R86504 TaxID=3093848 RepID=UPI0036725B53
MSIAPKTAAFLAGGVALVGIGAMTIATLTRPAADLFAACRNGAVAGGASTIGGPFELVDETGKTVTNTDVITGPTLVYFGYTFCPDVCPLDLTRNAEATYQLDEQGYDVTPVFISVDAERDTPEVLAEFTDIMHPRMIGLTGSAEQIKAASQAYKTYYSVQTPGDPYTLIDHSTQSYLMLPEYGFVDFFSHNDSADLVAEKMACYLEAAEQA